MLSMWSAARRLRASLVAFSFLAATGCRSTSSSADGSAAQHKAGTGSGDKSAARRPTRVTDVLRPGDPGINDMNCEVHADQGARPISPLIYGINNDMKDAAAHRWGVFRMGGNRSTAYNWENNASNAGADWHYQNDSLASTSDVPLEPGLRGIDAATRIGAVVIVTVSNADYVSADKKGDGDVRNSGPNYLTTRFKRNYPKKPTPFSPLPDPNDDAVYQDEMVAFLRAQRPQTKFLFSMDNEPDLWAHTHAEIFPKPVTYADLWKRNHDFAKATKEAYPGAQVLGPVSYGYQGFVSLQKASDAADRPFLEWYLDQAREAEAKEGVRLIDYLDLHWYPEATGGGQRIVGENVAAETVEARVQAPRSLWDARYRETSWIADAMGGPIDLLHWVQKKIDAHYPGTKLAFTEWNYGGGTHISGAIAVADVVGIFARHGVSLATYWPMAKEEPFAYAGFRVFRNYDGRGAGFGDTLIDTRATNAALGSCYASIDSSDVNRTVLIAINKATTPKRAGFQIFHSAIYTKASVFVLSGGEPVIKPAEPLSPMAPNAFRYEMPAMSISVVVPEQ